MAGARPYWSNLGDMATLQTIPLRPHLEASFFRPQYRRVIARSLLTHARDQRPRARTRYATFAPIASREGAGGPHYDFEWGAENLVRWSSPEFADAEGGSDPDVAGGGG